LNIRDLSALKSAQAIDRYLQRQLEAQRGRDRQSSGGEYLGYDADTGLHSVELPDGGIVQGGSITTAGLESGDSVAVGRSGVYGRLKAMPR